MQIRAAPELARFLLGVERQSQRVRGLVESAGAKKVRKVFAVPCGKKCASSWAMDLRTMPAASVAWPRYSSKVTPPKVKPVR